MIHDLQGLPAQVSDKFKREKKNKQAIHIYQAAWQHAKASW